MARISKAIWPFPERIDLLNQTAAFFFRVVQDVLWKDILLHLARLTGPRKSAGKANLTLLMLPDIISDPSFAAEVKCRVDEAVSRCEFARQWRNRHLAHLDLSLALGDRVEPLPAVSRQDVEQGLTALAGILNTIEHHYFRSEVGFRYFLTTNDAESLIYYLQTAVRAEKLRRDRLRQGTLLPEDIEPPDSG